MGKYNEEQEMLNVESNVNKKQSEASIDRPINWLERVITIVDKFGFFKLIATIAILFMTYIAWNVASALNYEKIAEEVIRGKNQTHLEGSNMRKENNPKVMLSLTRMLNELQCERVSVLEMHNGKENPTSLPFIYCDMTYEETKGSTPYIAEEYENLNMSKFNFPNYLWKQRYFIGPISELYKIDKKLAMRLELNDIKYFGIMIIKNEVDIGFITVSYEEMPTQFEAHDIHVKLSDYAQEIGYYLDFSKYQKQIN